jgi:hypothetical protein
MKYKIIITQKIEYDENNVLNNNNINIELNNEKMLIQ